MCGRDRVAVDERDPECHHERDEEVHLRLSIHARGGFDEVQWRDCFVLTNKALSRARERLVDARVRHLIVAFSPEAHVVEEVEHVVVRRRERLCLGVEVRDNRLERLVVAVEEEPEGGAELPGHRHRVAVEIVDVRGMSSRSSLACWNVEQFVYAVTAESTVFASAWTL